MISMSGQGLQPFPAPTRWITDALQFLVGGIMLTQERLKELLHYDPEIGIFTWKVKPRRSHILVGSIAGCLDNLGYCIIGVDNRVYKAHRLAWLYMTGNFPKDQIDHINGRKSENSFANLREAGPSTNKQNLREATIKNRVGLLGVSMEGKSFRASIWHSGKGINLGCYKTPELAHAAYIEAKRRLHPFGML